MPSITPRARDSQGNDQTDVRVLEGGKVLAEKLDGRAIPIDPGPRRLRFERAGSPPVEQTIVVREGEKARPIDVVFAAPPAASPPLADPSGGGGGGGFRIPAVAWVLVGVSAVGAGGLAFFGVRAKNEVDDMRSTCAPNCDADRVDAAKRDSIIANISLGVGAAALAGALVVVIVDQPKSPPASASKKAALGGSLELRVAPGAAPGVILRGAF
jgi:hypothetical protein